MRTIVACAFALSVLGLGCQSKGSVSGSPAATSSGAAPGTARSQPCNPDFEDCADAKSAPSAAAPPAMTQDAALAACKTGDARGCSTACSGGDLPSCATDGELLLKTGSPSEKAACESPLRKACDGNIGRACSNLASRCLPTTILATGRKTFESDKKEQAALNLKACNLNDGFGCLNASITYESGYGVDPDTSQAATLASKALRLLGKECDAGDGKSCRLLAMQYDPATKSNLVTKNGPKAGGLYKKACDAGEDTACDPAKRLLK